MKQEIDHSERAHHPLGASQWPNLSGCGAFKYKETDEYNGEAAERGTAIHEAAEIVLRGGEMPQIEADMSEEADWLVSQARLLSGPLEFEKRLEMINSEWETEYFTTADLLCRDQFLIVDYKTGQLGNYFAQLCGMALPLFDEWKTELINAEIWYSRLQYKAKYKITKSIALKVFEQVKSNYETKTPRLCDSCEKCHFLTTCDAVNGLVNNIVNGREDWNLKEYHASRILEPVEMSKALDIAFLMNKWVDGVKYHASKLIGQGVEIPNYKLKARAGRKSIIDGADVKGLLDLTEEEMKPAYNIGLTKLYEVFAKSKDLKPATAQRQVKKILEPVLMESNPSFNLTKTTK